MAGGQSGDKFKVGPNKEKRLSRVSLVVPICVGNITHVLPPRKTQAQNAASHTWKLFVRAPDNSDLSHIIEKVSFTLHSSFAKPLREFTAPPFEVLEDGWGEFDVQIRIDFSEDAMEQPLKLTHRLKLFHEDEKQRESNKKPVVRETYDEIVFWEPTEAFYQRVKHTRAKKLSSEPDPLLPRYNEQAEVNSLLAARNRIAQERANMIERLESQGL